MKLKSTNIGIVLLVCFIIISEGLFAQDSPINISVDSNFNSFTAISLGRFTPSFNYLNHSPKTEDEQRYKKHKSLINSLPTKKNYKLYFDLACTLWELEKTVDAEKMFLTIVKSKEAFYTSSTYHSSDIPGDTSTNIYGYGSFTSNYKNYSCIYLTKIYLEQKKFEKALAFLEDAVKKYKVSYNCGTGFYRQQDEYDFLYASCYEGLNKHKEVIDLLLPSCLERNDEIIVNSIKKVYSAEQIKDLLGNAEASITFTLDSIPSFSYTTSNYGSKNAKTDTIKYVSGIATITLFESQINMPLPNFENGQILNRAMIVAIFKESDFYNRLQTETSL